MCLWRERGRFYDYCLVSIKHCFHRGKQIRAYVLVNDESQIYSSTNYLIFSYVNIFVPMTCVVSPFPFPPIYKVVAPIPNILAHMPILNT